MKASPIQYSFNAGEISPLLYGRTDQEWYPTALKTCLGYIPLIQGPITRCPGTKFVAEVRDSSAATIIRRFEFSTTQAYILEFGNLYLRFYKDNAQITLAAQGVTNITQANPAVVTYSGADTYANGDRVVITGVVGMTQVNNREFTVANVNAGANTFELSGINSTGFGAYVSGGSVAEIYEIATPYATADLPALKFTQSADTLYIRHPAYIRRTLTRTGHTNWFLNTQLNGDGPYLPTNVTATTLTLTGGSFTTNSVVTVTASAPVFTLVTDSARSIRWKDPAGNWTWLEITGVTSTTVVTAVIRGPNASAGTATTSWRLGLWSDTTGYSSCVTFFQDRLFEAGTPPFPSRLDGSRSGDYENFSPTDPNGTVTDSHAVSFTLNASTVDVIRWLLGDEKGLLVGTVSSEWLVRASSTGQALTPTNVQASQSTGHGSANIPAIRVGKAAMYVQRASRKLRELGYSFNEDGLVSPDRTVRAEHITRGGLKEIAYQQEPHSAVWGARNDGVLAGLTHDAEQKVLAWFRRILGGSFSTGAAVVESIAVIPAPDGSRDELWLIGKRTINGVTRRTIEYMKKWFEDGDDIKDAFFVDCGLTYSGAATTTITGLNHLEGETVSVLADGAAHPDVAVAGGTITLQQSASTVHVGYKFTSRGEALRIEAGAADGTAQGKIKRIVRVTMRFLASVGLSVGSVIGSLSPIIFRNPADPTNTAIPPFSGDKKVPFQGKYDRDGFFVWEQPQPLPSTILALMPQVTTEDDS